MGLADPPALVALEATIRAILPEEYQDHYDEVQPVSMGSALLKYTADGKVAWGEIWESFCDLAMAGGPPHKGTLLEPASPAEIAAQPDRYVEAVAEICRAVNMVTDLPVEPSETPGWVRVECETEGMAGWLVRAIAMENVSVHGAGASLFLPAGPGYRREKEIKNVVTSIAKTHHYWTGHMVSAQQTEIGDLLKKMDSQIALIQPELQTDAHDLLRGKLGERITSMTGLTVSKYRYAGWLGVDCPSVRSAVWMTRATVASNVLSRREGTILFVPINAASDPAGDTVAQTVARVHQFARFRKLL